jgi:hypothetical protein
MMKLVTPINDVHRRDYTLADTTLLDPTEADSLHHGEWMQMNSSAKLARPGSLAEEVKNAYMVFTPKGSYDAQALAKVAVIFSREFEVDTDMFDGGDTFTIGDNVGLTLYDVLGDGVSRMVFTNTLTADGSHYVYGQVTLDPDNNSDMLRVHLGTPYLLPTDDS